MDTFRFFHPTRTSAFTCWSTLTGARQTNYGTRIDYIFADCQLTKEQFVAADIMPEVEGSDHCPVWGQLSCSFLPSTKLPPLCTRYLPEFAGKQQKLSRFFAKVDQKPCPSEQREALPGSQEEEERRENLNPSGAVSISGKKRLLASDSVVPKGKKTKTVKTSSKPQGSLLSFFKPKFTNLPSTGAPVRDCENTLGLEVIPSQNPQNASTPREDVASVSQLVPEETAPVFDRQPQLRTNSATDENEKRLKTKCLTPQSTVEHSAAKKGTSLGFWKSVLHGPPPPPSCKVHGEPCVLRTVKKEGPNMGKQFFVCARPQGHASNPDARCNFFAWVDKGKWQVFWMDHQLFNSSVKLETHSTTGKKSHHFTGVHVVHVFFLKQIKTVVLYYFEFCFYLLLELGGKQYISYISVKTQTCPQTSASEMWGYDTFQYLMYI